MGDHMLSREYFPAAPLAMTEELRTAMISYYDFMTAYQDLLRGKSSKAASAIKVTTTANGVSANSWLPRANSIITFSKNVDNKQVIHLLNFQNTTDLSWRDLDGTRQEPPLTKNLPLTVSTLRSINKVWVASPDVNGGVVQELDFTQQNGKVTFTLPSLKYWTMVVMESDLIEEKLFITGDAVQRSGYGAYDLHQAVPMKRSTDGHTFTVTTHLKGHQLFKFTNGQDWGTCTSFNAEYAGYMFNDTYNIYSGNVLINGNGDYKFMVDEEGDYTITINLSTLRIYVVKGSVDGIMPTEQQSNDSPAEYFTFSGIRTQSAADRGVYIMRKGKHTYKLIRR